MSQPDDPITRFQEVFARAKESEATDPTAASLATVDAAGRPSARLVLLKQIDRRGFVFYTNYDSRKARELRGNPNAALCFFWPSIGEQVRVEGTVSLLTDEEADAYFKTRDRMAQIGAWASRQSAVLGSREQLEDRFCDFEARFEGQPVPRPPFWGGYRLVPDRIEFWRSREHRLHDRWLFLRQDDGWKVQRLYP